VTTVTGVVAPRIIGAGALLDSQRFLTHVERVDRMVAARGVQPLAFDPPVQRVSVSAAAQVRSAVDRVLALEGVFVKVRTYESPEVFFAIAREAKRRGLSFAGHSPPEGVSWTEAVSAGMTSIEHMGGSYAAQLGQLSPAERHSVYQGLIRGGAFVDPNVLCEIIRAMPDTRARALVHASAAGLMTYNPWNTPQLKDVFRRELAIRLLEKQIAPAPDWASTSRQEFTLLKELSSNGVPVLAGTDLGSLLIYPGSPFTMNSRVSWTRWDSCPSRPFGLRPLLRRSFQGGQLGPDRQRPAGRSRAPGGQSARRHQNDPPHP
jgi:hypothetical protein